MGIALSQGRQSLRRNRIEIAGLKGTGFGITAHTDSVLTMTENAVLVRSAVAEIDGKASALGVDIQRSEVTSVRNAFRFEAPGNADPAAIVTVFGISVAGPKRVTSDGDRVVGPTVLSPDDRAGRLTFLAFSDTEGGLARVVNASVVLDSRRYDLAPSAGIYFAEKATATLAHNSMYFTKSRTPSESPLRGFDITPGSALTITSNLVTSDDPRMAFVLAECGQSGIAELAHNRYGVFDAPSAHPDCTTGTLDELWPDAGGDDNIAITCPPEGGCAALFASVEMAADDGLRLADAGCALALGVPLTTGIDVDGAGKARSGGKTTAGAFACE